MSGETGIEKEFGVDLDAENPDVKKGIEAGIRVEEKQSLFYSHMTEVLHNHDFIHFFRFLSEEKKLQKEILEKEKEFLEENGEWLKLEYDYGDLEDAFRKVEGLRKKKLRADAGDVDVITSAMKNEEGARRFYERFADALRGEGNEFFRRLSEREQRHHDLLSGLLDSLRHSELREKKI
jgi:rubrerythrin